MKTSTTEEYDNRNVIIQIANLKDAVEDSGSETAEEAKRIAQEAMAEATAVGAQVDALEPQITQANVTAEEALTAAGDANTAIGGVDKAVKAIGPSVAFSEATRLLEVTVNGKTSSATISGGSGGGGTGTVSINQGPTGITINDIALQDATEGQDGLMTKELVVKVNTAGDATATANEAKRIAESMETRVATNEGAIAALQTGKQDAGDYALKSEIPSVAGLATQSALEQGLAGKQDKLVAGDNISIVGNTISAAGGGSANTIKQVRDQITFWYTEVYEVRENNIGTWYDSDHKVGLVQNVPVTGGTAQGLVMNLEPLRTEPSATEKASLSYPAGIMAEYASTCVTINGNFTGIIRLTALPKLIRINNKDSVNAWYKEGWHFTNVDLEYKNGVLLSTDADNWPSIVRPDGVSTLTGASIEMKWNLMIREITGGFE